MPSIYKNGIRYSGAGNLATEYPDLNDLPSINGHTLTGDKDKIDLELYDFQLVYIVTGATALSSGWLSKIASGTALTPDAHTLYIIVSTGDYENQQYRWDEAASEYVLISSAGGSGGGFQLAYIVSGSTNFSSGWLSETDGGTALTPDPDMLYIVASAGSYYNNMYRYNGSTYDMVSSGTNTGATSYNSLTSKPSINNVTLSGNITLNQLGIKDMVGSDNYNNGERGFVPQPLSTDVGKFLGWDGQWHTIYSSDSGSTVVCITNETSLYGRTVTMTDGITTLSGTFDANGKYVFYDVQMYGVVTFESEAANGDIARSSLNLTYFGTYATNLTMNFATINFTSSDMDLIGKSIDVYHNGVVVATAQLALISNSPTTLGCTIYVEEIGGYTAKTAAALTTGLGQGVCIVSALRQSYTCEIIVYHCYTFCIDGDDSNPATCVTPFMSQYGCENIDFTPAHMDFGVDSFDYGDWTGDEFFFPKPCMLGYDGQVKYFLDPNDYTKKTDGTASDVADDTYAGNVMMQFPTVYFKRWQSGNKSYVVISNKQIDSDFHAYAHHDVNGNVNPYIYIAAYDGSYDGTRLRSISGKAVMSDQSAQTECNRAAANNQGNGAEEWYIWHKADWDLVHDLTLLLTMNTDSQSTIGRGNNNGYNSTPNTSIYQNSGNGRIYTGSCNTKGLFWGANDNSTPVKIFGIENFYGNIWKRCTGWWYTGSVQKVKMSYGQEDGSTVDGFNFDGSGYVEVASSGIGGSSGSYISQWKYSEQGFVPIQVSGSDSTYLCDGCWMSSNAYALCGGSSSDGGPVGVSCVVLNFGPGDSYWGVGAALTYKPLVA